MQSLRYFLVKKSGIATTTKSEWWRMWGAGALGVLYHVRNRDKKECISFTPFITIIVFLPPENKLVLKDKYPLYLIQDL